MYFMCEDNTNILKFNNGRSYNTLASKKKDLELRAFYEDKFLDKIEFLIHTFSTKSFRVVFTETYYESVIINDNTMVLDNSSVKMFDPANFVFDLLSELGCIKPHTRRSLVRKYSQ